MLEKISTPAIKVLLKVGHNNLSWGLVLRLFAQINWLAHRALHKGQEYKEKLSFLFQISLLINERGGGRSVLDRHFEENHKENLKTDDSNVFFIRIISKETFKFDLYDRYLYTQTGYINIRGLDTLRS